MRIGTLPKDLAGAVIDGQERRFAARREDQAIRRGVDQWALPGIPRRDNGLVIQHQVDEPIGRAAVRVPANHLALRPERHDPLAGNRGNRPRHAVVRRDRDRIAVPPQLFAVVQRQASHHVGAVGRLVQNVVEDIDSPAADRRRGITFAQFDAPQPPWAAARPMPRQANGLLIDRVMVRAAEARPRPAIEAGRPAE